MHEAIEHLVYMSGGNSDAALASLDQQIRSLVRACKMPSPYIELDYQTEPSFFSALSVYGHRHDMILIRPPGFESLAGLGIRSVSRAYLGGKIVELGYLHHLRFLPEIRGGSFLLRGYKALRQVFNRHPVSATLTAILEDNRPARAALENQRAGGTMPVYKPISRFLTALIPLRGPGARWPQRYRTTFNSAGPARKLTQADLPQLLALFVAAGQCNEGSPAYVAADFADPAEGRLAGLDITSMIGIFIGSELHAAIGIWNQQTYKQIVLSHLCIPLLALRDAWQAGRALWGDCPIPAVGEKVNSVLLDPWVVRPGFERELMPELLAAAMREAQSHGALFAAFGVAEKNPAINAVKSVFFLPYWSIIYQVFWPETLMYEFDTMQLKLANLGAL